jgi:hypothetical protein
LALQDLIRARVSALAAAVGHTALLGEPATERVMEVSPRRYADAHLVASTSPTYPHLSIGQVVHRARGSRLTSGERTSPRTTRTRLRHPARWQSSGRGGVGANAVFRRSSPRSGADQSDLIRRGNLARWSSPIRRTRA